MRIVALVLACSGCAQLFGIEDTSSSNSTVSLERVSIGSTVMTAPLDLGSATPAFLTGTGTTMVPATMTTAGEWSAAVASPLAFVYTAPDLPKPYQHALELAPSQRAAFYAFEHPNPQPAPASMVTVDVTLPGTFAVTQTLEVLAIGAWTSHVLSGAELPAAGASAIAATIPYTQFLPVTASAAARISSQDQVLVLRYSGATLTGQLIVPPFDQSTTTDTIMGTMAAVTPTAMWDAKIDPTGTAGRLAMPMPAATNAATFAWELDAAPGYSAGTNLGVRLDAGAAAMTDTAISGMYANPFAGIHWPPLLVYQAAASRTYTMGTVAVTLSASLTSLVDPASGLTLDLAAPLAKTITLEQQALTMDGAMVHVDPTAALEVGLTTDTSPPNVVYDVLVEEITTTGGTPTLAPVVDVVALAPTLTLPANVLQVGHTYTISATCTVGGYPNAASGDLQTFALPTTFGTASSGVFTVAGP